jgi:hypothetical protein
MSEAPEGFSTSPYRKLSDDEIAELQKHLPSVRMREQASLIEQQAARIKELKEELEDQTSIFYAWFDTQELAHEAIDKAVLDAAKGYLRTCRVGGMCEWESGCIEAVFADMANLSVFANLFARTKMPLPSAPKQRKENKT